MSENTTAVAVWSDDTKLVEIKKIFAKDLTPTEFQAFVGIGQSTGLNPFLREIWAVKYGSNPASIFVGRDWYRKSAQASKEYDWHFVDAIYANDTFKVKNGEIEHDYASDRGALIGAYGLCKRKSSSRPNFVQVSLKEYSTGKSLWTSKPETMIKKVAEAQVLRMTFQELFGGTYDESEQWDDKNEKTVPVPRVNEAKNTGETPSKPIEASATLISKEDADKIMDLFKQLGYTEEQLPERIAALETRLGKSFAELTSGEARDTIKKMQEQIAKKAATVEVKSDAPDTVEAVVEEVIIPPMEEEKSFTEKVAETVEKKRAAMTDEERIAEVERKRLESVEGQAAAIASEQTYARGVKLDD